MPEQSYTALTARKNDCLCWLVCLKTCFNSISHSDGRTTVLPTIGSDMYGTQKKKSSTFQQRSIL